jgi:peptidyl-prolyl cis-trans isomerase A (cyclophilin A)
MKILRFETSIGTLLLVFAIASNLHAQTPPPGGGGVCTNCPPWTNEPSVIPTDYSTIDLNIRYVGTMRLALFDRDKPATVKNFLNYVLSGAYSNNFIHYDSTNLICQGGSLRVINFGSGGQSVVPVTENASITNEFGVGRFFSNLRGTIAMAHYPGQTNNTTCHWFINLVNNSALDAPDTNHAYVVFGHVISGLTNLNRLNPTATNTTIKLMNLGGWLNSCPVNYSASPATVTYSNLLTVGYNLVTMDIGLQVQRIPTNTSRVTWQSVSNRPHTVFYRPELGGTWTNVWTTNGSGATQFFLHKTNPATGFYRVSFLP